MHAFQKLPFAKFSMSRVAVSKPLGNIMPFNVMQQSVIKSYRISNINLHRMCFGKTLNATKIVYVKYSKHDILVLKRHFDNILHIT